MMNGEMNKARTAKAGAVIGQLYALMGNRVGELCDPLSAVTGHQVTQSTIDDWRAAREEVPPDAYHYMKEKLADEEERLR